MNVAERFDELARAIDRWVTQQAIAILADDRHADDQLHVNLSGRSIGDHALLDLIAAETAAAGVSPSRLTFKITETAAVVNVERAGRFVTAVRRLGCEIAIDDFGAGFASFGFLRRFEFDLVKIDGGFIRNLPQTPTDALVVEAVVGIARGLGKRTVGEFVGDEQTVARLRELGVDDGQGYHLGPPGAVLRPAAALADAAPA